MPAVSVWCYSISYALAVLVGLDDDFLLVDPAVTLVCYDTRFHSLACPGLVYRPSISPPPPSASSVVANRMTFLTRALYNEPDRQSSRTRVCIWSIIVLIYWWFIFHIQIYVFFTSLCHLENLDLGVCN